MRPHQKPTTGLKLDVDTDELKRASILALGGGRSNYDVFEFLEAVLDAPPMAIHRTPTHHTSERPSSSSSTRTSIEMSCSSTLETYLATPTEENIISSMSTVAL
ncbi:hypothetical protein [Halocatena salina]|uniref:Uncharacterized protein n=1 Tax=Halocatena salina TaxID=2934340 RepID=A0A8U0AAC2_9EURY|nr:hypothetical protein [Halocatena salina]UPM44747.1 hypothetical protein MW046_17105 [Halocatena salina]